MLPRFGEMDRSLDPDEACSTAVPQLDPTSQEFWDSVPGPKDIDMTKVPGNTEDSKEVPKRRTVETTAFAP